MHIKEIKQERRALHEHIERLSCGGNAPEEYFIYDVPERFAKLHRLSIVDSLARLAFCLMGYTIHHFRPLV